MLPCRPFALTLLLIGGAARAQFGTPQLVGAFDEPSEVRCADLDSDGDLDLFVIENGDELVWSANLDGQGSFGPLQMITDLDGPCREVDIADVDGDNDPDVLYVAEEQGIVFLRNTGAGSFAAPEFIPTPAGPHALNHADLNGDGRMDLLITLFSPEGPGMAWAAGTETGFADFAVHTNLHSGGPSDLLLVGDLDLVGGLDLVVSGASDSLYVLRNVEGDGMTWGSGPLPVPAGELLYSYRRPQLIDVDGDGDADLAESRSPAVHWLRNDLDEGGALAFTDLILEPWTTSGPGTFAPSPCGEGAALVLIPGNPSLPVRWTAYLPVLGDLAYSADLPQVPRGTDPVLADVNGDSRVDLLMNGPDGLALFLNTLGTASVTLELPEIAPLCMAGPPVALPDANIPGGRWYGDQIGNDLLFRSNIGMSMHLPVVHAVHPAGECPQGMADTVRLLEGPIILTQLPTVLCSNDAPIQLNSDPAEVAWYGLDGSDVINPAAWAGGYVRCEYTDATGTMCHDLEGPIQRWLALPASIEETGPFCAGDGVQTIMTEAAPPFNVEWLGPVSNTTLNSADFDPTIGVGSHTIILKVTPFAPNQCGNSDTLVVVVNPVPEIAFEPMPLYCTSGEPIELNSASPEGGVWSGSGVSNGQLNPAELGGGTHLLSYFVLSPEGCGAQAATAITLVDSTTIHHEAPDLLLCPGDAPVMLDGYPAGGDWSGPISGSGILDPATLAPGPLSVSYSFTDPRGCVVTGTPLNAEMGLARWVTIAEVPPLCLSTPPFILFGSESGVWSGSLAGEGIWIPVDPGALGVGTWPMTLTVSPEGSCPGSASIDLQVDVCTGMEGSAMVVASLAPNPFSNATSVSVMLNGNAVIEVIDLAGRKVLNRAVYGQGITRMELDLGGEPAGTYSVHIADARSTTVLRAIKMD